MFECWGSRDKVFAFDDGLYGVHFLHSLKEARKKNFAEDGTIDVPDFGDIIPYLVDMHNHKPNTALPPFGCDPRIFQMPEYYESYEFQYSKRVSVWKQILDTFAFIGYSFPDGKTCAYFFMANLELLSRLAKLKFEMCRIDHALKEIGVTVEITSFGFSKEGGNKDVEVIVRDDFDINLVTERVLIFFDILIFEMEKFLILQNKRETT